MAQTLNDIISTYIKNTGGKTNEESLKGLKKIGIVNAPYKKVSLEILTLKDGEQ